MCMVRTCAYKECAHVYVRTRDLWLGATPGKCVGFVGVAFVVVGFVVVVIQAKVQTDTTPTKGSNKMIHTIILYSVYDIVFRI